MSCEKALKIYFEGKPEANRPKVCVKKNLEGAFSQLIRELFYFPTPKDFPLTLENLYLAVSNQTKLKLKPNF